MARLSYAPKAQKDIKETAEYIARDKPDAARKWLAKIRRKCRLLAKNPELGDARGEFGSGVRSSYVGDYVIYFQNEAGVVEIIRVIRGDREIRYL